jgi:CBS domain-containing protein
MHERVMTIATKEVKTIPAKSTIMNALKLMLKHNFRRMPIADPGTKKLMGIVTTTDLINFFGGGKKYNLVKNRFNGNLLAAVNEHVDEIMEKNVISLKENSTLKQTIDLFFENSLGGAPIVDKDKKIKGIITERDLLKYLYSQEKLDGHVKDYMTTCVFTANIETSIEEAMRIMIERKIRRLPVVENGKISGLITSREVIRYFGTGEAFRFLETGNIKDAINKPLRIILENQEIMKHRPVLMLPPKTKISQLVEKMLEEKTGVALIVRKKTLLGIITERDLIKFLHERLI